MTTGVNRRIPLTSIWKIKIDRISISTSKTTRFYLRLRKNGRRPQNVKEVGIFLTISFQLSAKKNLPDLEEHHAMFVEHLFPTVSRLASGTLSAPTDVMTNMTWRNLWHHSEMLLDICVRLPQIVMIQSTTNSRSQGFGQDIG